MTQTQSTTTATATSTSLDARLRRIWELQSIEFMKRLAVVHGGASSGAFCAEVAAALVDAVACCPTLPAADAWTVGAIAGAINVAATERDAPLEQGRERAAQLAAMVACTPPAGIVGVAREVALLLFADDVDAAAIGAVVGRSDHLAAEQFSDRIVDAVLTAERAGRAR